MGKQTRVVRLFDVVFDSEDGKLHVNLTTVTEVHSARGREWQQDQRDYEKDVLVLTPDEFQRLVGEGFSAISYEMDLIRRAGVRVDRREETVYTSREIPVRTDD